MLLVRVVLICCGWFTVYVVGFWWGLVITELVCFVGIVGGLIRRYFCFGCWFHVAGFRVVFGVFTGFGWVVVCVVMVHIWMSSAFLFGYCGLVGCWFGVSGVCLRLLI